MKLSGKDSTCVFHRVRYIWIELNFLPAVESVIPTTRDRSNDATRGSCSALKTLLPRDDFSKNRTSNFIFVKKNQKITITSEMPLETVWNEAANVPEGRPSVSQSDRGLVGRGDAAHRHRGQTRGQVSQLQGEEEERQCCGDPGPAAGQQASGRHWLQQQQVFRLDCIVFSLLKIKK